MPPHTEPTEISRLDHRIAQAGGTTSRVELSPDKLRRAKAQPVGSPATQIHTLIRENGYLRQEIVFYEESKNALAAFHEQMQAAFDIMQAGLKDLSERLMYAEEKMEKYWGIPVNGARDRDLFQI